MKYNFFCFIRSLCVPKLSTTPLLITNILLQFFDVETLCVEIKTVILLVMEFILLKIFSSVWVSTAERLSSKIKISGFLITAFLTKPDIFNILKGALIPSFPEGSLLTILGLVGTTVVPYNLFLHASLVKEKWNNPKDLKEVRKDTIFSIALGGLVSMAIIISASSIGLGEISSAADLAKSLAPLYGDFASYFLGIGLFAAGITSAITAPLAAAYVARGCFGWESGLKSKQFRAVWFLILLLGVVFSSLGLKPIEIIKFAQVANGVLLPVVAGILLWMVNKKVVLGKYVNSKFQNILGFIILIITIFLGLRGLDKVFEFNIFWW